MEGSGEGAALDAAVDTTLVWDMDHAEYVIARADEAVAGCELKLAKAEAAVLAAQEALDQARAERAQLEE